jgi:hypothetical protein
MDNSEANLTKELSLPLYQSKGWMKFLGVMMIIWGVLITLSTLGIGIVVAWLPIWLGVLLFQSASSVEQAQATGDKAAMIQSMSKLKLYFVITGVLTLIMLLLTLLGMVTGMGGFMAMMQMKAQGM